MGPAVSATICRMPTLPLSLVVITHNEAANIARCLDSVPFATEKLVVDSGSTDGTPDLARAKGARVFVRGWPGYSAQKNFAAGDDAAGPRCCLRSGTAGGSLP